MSTFIKRLKLLQFEGRHGLFRGISRFLLDPFCLFLSFEIYLPVNERIRFYIEKNFSSFLFIREDWNIDTKTVIKRDRKEYLNFITELKNITKNWQEDYQPPIPVRDGSRLTIICNKINLFTNIHSAYPDNFSEYENLVSAYFPKGPLNF